MASRGDEFEYESDSEEVKRSLVTRRREASDDEGSEGGVKPRMHRRELLHSDDSDGEGGVADYDDYDEESDGLDDDEEFYEDEEDAYEDDVGGQEVDEGRVEMRGTDDKGGVVKKEGGDGVEGEDGKKEAEPFAVPTAGFFYMHDDRFRENARGRPRRSRGARRLWESKGEEKWGHDKFEELTSQERQYEERRKTSRGRYRGRGRSRGTDYGYGRGNGRKAFNNNQNQAPNRVVRGRGPRKYVHAVKSSRSHPNRSEQTANPRERTSQTVDANNALLPLTKASTKAESASVTAKKHPFASSLSYASPPFYPSNSANNGAHKKDLQAGSMAKNLRSSIADGNFAVSQSSSSLRGKNIVDALAMEKLHIAEGTSGSLSSLQMPSAGSSQMKRHAVQRGPTQSRIQSAVQVPGGQMGRPSVNGSNDSSLLTGELESVSESGKPKGALIANGKGKFQGNGRGTFLYGGTQVAGASANMAFSHGDQNFPTFLPVMQFGGQHPGGIGVPALGMAFPGYVGQPGSGNSEMTWLPVLAGAGALGTTYCPPYLAVDGSYHALPSGQPSPAGTSSKEQNANEPSIEWKTSQKPGLINNEFAPRQDNLNRQPRRYSEMSFSK